MTIKTNTVAGGAAAAGRIAAADRARREGAHDEAVRLYEDAASTFELPPAELCFRLARAKEQLEHFDDAWAWLKRGAEVAVSFREWSTAASVHARLARSARPSARRRARVVISGSYTTSQLTTMLPVAGHLHGMDLEVSEGLFDQYQQDVIDPASSLYGADPDVVVLAVHEGALQLPSHSDRPEEHLEREEARWRMLWETVGGRSHASIVQHLFAARPEAPTGHLGAGDPGLRESMLAEINRRLAGDRPSHVSVVDCDRLASTFGRSRWFDDRYWLRSKQAVGLEALPMLARHTAAVIAARLGLARKCLVLDLDNTLWGGVIGEDGLDGIQLGEDGVGDAFVAFQEYVLRLKERGVILAVASKNNEADAREVFLRHPSMRIRLDDIAMFAVNWEDKPANLRRIAQALGIGLDALTLADDNPAERQIVRSLVPEVDVLPLPPDPAEYRRTLSEYVGFEPAMITSDDRKRTEQYRARAALGELRSAAADIESFYRDLDMSAEIGRFDAGNLPRIVQLLGKTNQFNLTTRRHGPQDVERMMADNASLTYFLKLTDRLADHGLVAVLIAAVEDDVADIDTFLMSCRVIGRTVEGRMLARLSVDALACGCTKLRGTFVPTSKNAIVRDLYGRYGFRLVGSGEDGTTRWEYDLHAHGPITNEFVKELRP